MSWIAIGCGLVAHAQVDSTGSVGLGTFEVRPSPWYTGEGGSGARSSPDSTLLDGFERSSLRPALLWVPGVQMDERGHGGSTRLSIRGSLLRAPFGVRGVKVYFGPFPLTLADGSTPLELMDPMLCDVVQVDRHLGAPLNGTAPAGLLRADLAPRRPGETSLNAEAIGGPYGYYRLAVRGGSDAAAGGVEAGLVRQRNDGYRQQEYTARDQFFINTGWHRQRTAGRVFLTWQQARWALPGGLDSTSAVQAPRSARPYAQLIDARVEKQQVFAGLATEMRMGASVVLRSGVHAQRIDKINPYGNTAAASGDKEESITAAGGRVSVEGSCGRDGRWLTWNAGLEVLAEHDQLDEHAFRDGMRDSLRIRADTRVANLNAFAGVEVTPWSRTRLQLAAGTERTGYDHHDLLTDAKTGRTLAPAPYPMIAWDQRWTSILTTTLRCAASVSRPTVWELLGSSGTFNTELAPEHVRELQFSLFAAGDSSSTGFSVSVYRRWVQGMILMEPAAVEGTVRFVNAGTALLDGVEAEAHGLVSLNSRWKLWLGWTLTLQDHRVQRNDTLPELAVPGVVPLQFGLRARGVRTGTGHAEVGFRVLGTVPACLGCGDEVPGYVLGHLRLGWAPAPGTELFIHLENLFDAHYTAFVQVDDPGRRYYNPAPPFGLYAGLRWEMARKN